MLIPMPTPEPLETACRLAHLGPAEVVRPGVHEITIRLETGDEVAAQPALPYPYAAEPGDVVLAIGHEERYFVIGILSGRGKTRLEIQGDVTLRAVEGTLDLQGDRGMKLQGPEIDIMTPKLRVLAESMVQKCTHVYQRVRDLFTFRAGRAHSVVEGTSFSKSRQAVIVSDEKVMINGKQIHLG